MSRTETDIGARSDGIAVQQLLARACELLPFALIAAVAAGYAARFIDPPTLWFDEAMLFVNVRDIAWHELLQPLPFYDQVAPIAYIALLKAIHGVAGLTEAALRLPSWLALIATFALIARLPDTDRATRLIVAALLAGSFVTARIATDAKPYMFEALAAFAMIVAFHPRATGVWASAPVRLALLLAAMLMTTAFPLVAFAIGAPMVLSAARADLVARRPLTHWQCLAPAALFAVALAFYAVYFAGYLSPSLKLVAANHAYGYGPSGYAAEGTSYPLWLIGRGGDIITSHWQAWTSFIAVATLAGGYILARLRSIYAAQAAALLGIVVAANFAGFFPIMEERFSVFMLPWVTLLAASGIAGAVTRLPSPVPRSLAISGCVAAALLPAIDAVRDPFHHQARASLAHAAAAPAIPLATTLAGQAIIDAYQIRAPHDRKHCTVTAALATTTRCTARREDTDGRFEGAATKWYLLNYAEIASWGGSDYGFPGASLDAFAAAYYDWIVAGLRRHQRAHVLIVQGNERMLAAVRTRLGPGERLRRVIDERPPSPTLAHGAAQLFLYEAAPR